MSTSVLLKSFNKIYSLVILTMLFAGCQMQNDSEVLDFVTDNEGQSVTSFEDIYNNTERDFRIREEEGVVTLEREALTTPNRVTRKAVVVSSYSLAIKESHRESGPSTGYTLTPLSEVDLFWPINRANDHVEIKWTSPQGADVIGWVKYLDSNQNTLVKVLEDFIIESVNLGGAKIIRPTTQSGPLESVTEFEATEEIIEFEPIASDEDEVNYEQDEALSDEVDTDDATLTAPVIDTSPDFSSEPEVTVVITQEETPVEADEVPPTVDDSEDDEHENETHGDEDASTTASPSVNDLAVSRSLIPPVRPDDLVTTRPERDVTDIVEALGLRPIPIPFSISTARSRINVVSPSRQFSGCSFAPTLGNRSGRDCYRDLVLAEDFVRFLEEHAHQCSIDAAIEAFNRTPVLIQFTSNAGSVTRASSRSLHIRGRALDLLYATVFWSEDSGDKRQIRLHKDYTDGSSQTERENHDFYWSFVNCWRGKIRTLAPNSCGASIRGGALTYRFNRAHRDHIHLALPLSNSERREHSLNCL